jgi:predicted ATP-dependent serine protease
MESDNNNETEKLSRKSPIVYMTPKKLMEIEYEELAFDGEWGEFIGRPSPSFGAIVHGPPKNGKSTFCLKLAAYLCRFGRVMYVSGEEGFAKSLKDRVQRLQIDNDNLFFIKERKTSRIEQAIENKRPQFILIDSAHHVGLLPEKLKSWREKFPTRAFVVILKSTKDGNYRGDTDWEHDVDVVISLKDGVATQRGRFNQESSMRLNFAKPKPATLFEMEK